MEVGESAASRSTNNNNSAERANSANVKGNQRVLYIFQTTPMAISHHRDTQRDHMY